MAGTGASSLGDAVRLTRGAIELGFRAALVLPPFFFRDASLDGVVRFYVELAGAVPNIAGKLLLYNFPKMSGFAFTPAVMRRLVAELPDVIAGLKDSSNDRELQRVLTGELPWLRVFPGSEAYLPQTPGFGCFRMHFGNRCAVAGACEACVRWGSGSGGACGASARRLLGVAARPGHAICRVTTTRRRFLALRHAAARNVAGGGQKNARAPVDDARDVDGGVARTSATVWAFRVPARPAVTGRAVPEARPGRAFVPSRRYR